MEKLNERLNPREFAQRLIRKPFSLIVTLIALSLIGLTLFELGRGSLYNARLNYVDVTTLAMVGLLFLRAVTRLHSASDLETYSIASVSALSFLYGYEAIYKWSFWVLPWKMPAHEIRELVLQIAIASVIMAGFALGRFRLGRMSWLFLLLFVIGWLFWLGIGFPQLFDETNFRPILLDLPDDTGNDLYCESLHEGCLVRTLLQFVQVK